MPLVSFAYRKGTNAQKAAQKVHSNITDGYIYALDADLKGFFDNIPHHELFEQVNSFFPNMQDVQKLIFRFIHIDKGIKCKNNKVNRSKREKGIPQGGIISGMLANIYLHQFDVWVMNELNEKYDLKYTRYADDFVILAKNQETIVSIKEECRDYLSNLKLELHPDEKKTKIVLISKRKGIDFVGFHLTSNNIGIKLKNEQNFKERVLSIIVSSDLKTDRDLEFLKYKCSFKYFGNEVKKLKCLTCNKFEVNRNWMKFFLVITDVNQLRKIDKWVYKQINYHYYKLNKERLSKDKLKKLEFPSLELLYYRYRKELKKSMDYCKCDYTEKDLIQTLNPYEELFKEY